jgi:nucleoside-triphosphatase
MNGMKVFGEEGQGSQTPAPSPNPLRKDGSMGFQPVQPGQDARAARSSETRLYLVDIHVIFNRKPRTESGIKGGWGGEFEGSVGKPRFPGPSLKVSYPPRLLLTGPPQCGKTTVVRRVAERFPGRAAGFYTREVRECGRRVGFEIITLDGEAAWLSHVDFPGPNRVGKYGVDLEGLHRLGLASLELAPGIDLIVVDEVGKMECLSLRFVAAMERLWAAPVPLLVTVAEKGGGYIARIKGNPGARLITVTPANRDGLPDRILAFLEGAN